MEKCTGLNRSCNVVSQKKLVCHSVAKSSQALPYKQLRITSTHRHWKVHFSPRFRFSAQRYRKAFSVRADEEYTQTRQSGELRVSDPEVLPLVEDSGTVQPVPQGFVVASDIDGQDAILPETDRFLRLEALVQLRRLYRSIELAERTLGLHGELEGESLATLKQKLSDLKCIQPADKKSKKSKKSKKNKVEEDDEFCATDDGKDLMEEEAALILDAVEACEMLEETSKRMQGLMKVMMERGAFDLLWPEKSKNEKVLAIIEKRLDTLSNCLELNEVEVMELLPADTLKEAQAQATLVLERQRESEVSSSFGRVGKSIGRAEAQLSKGFGQIRETKIDSFDMEKLKETGDYLKGVWGRLNGSDVGASKETVTSLPLPSLSKQKTASQESRAQLTLEVAERSKEFDEACRAREKALRDQGVLDRARFAADLRAMDQKVDDIRKELVVMTLQLQMEFVESSLEEEAVDVTEGGAFRDREVELFVAEFGGLDARLARLAQAVKAGESILIKDEYLADLATDIPDLKVRLGILDDPTAPLMDVSWQRVQRSAKEAKAKVEEGVGFVSRALRLLGGDVWYSVQLIGRALQGRSLKTREVLALRRTSTDLVTFPIFAAILIAPLSPVGHVLVFSFIQQYFPGAFPSQFKPRRQELLQRVEELSQQLRDAESEWMDKSDIDALKKAEAAVSALLNDGVDSDDNPIKMLRDKFQSASVEVLEAEAPEEKKK